MLRLIREQMQRGETPVLHVMKANETARGLYRRMGFATTGRWWSASSRRWAPDGGLWMRTVHIIRSGLIILVAALLQACAGAPIANAQDRVALIAALTRQADAWDKAIVSKDRAAIEANMADDFRQIGSNGEVETKRSFVDDLVSPELLIDPYTVEDFDVRLYGEVALLSGRTRMTGRYQGRPFSSHYRYIDVYVRTAGQWKIVSVQTTRMAK